MTKLIKREILSPKAAETLTKIKKYFIDWVEEQIGLRLGDEYTGFLEWNLEHDKGDPFLMQVHFHSLPLSDYYIYVDIKEEINGTTRLEYLLPVGVNVDMAGKFATIINTLNDEFKKGFSSFNFKKILLQYDQFTDQSMFYYFCSAQEHLIKSFEVIATINQNTQDILNKVGKIGG